MGQESQSMSVVSNRMARESNRPMSGESNVDDKLQSERSNEQAASIKSNNKNKRQKRIELFFASIFPVISLETRSHNEILHILKFLDI